MNTIVKATTRGQVTLPAKWRRSVKTDRFLMTEKDETLLIRPLQMEELNEDNWETIFDAQRDNRGKGVPIEKMIKALKKSLR